MAVVRRRYGGGGLARALHGLLLTFPVALFTSAVATDITYLNTAEMQWTNFSAWLIAGGLVFGGLVLLLALIDLFRRSGGGLVYFLVLAVMWVVGLVNAFKHSQDAWSSVGALGLVLSIITALLALIAGVMFYGRSTVREEGL